jgi:hypothetical protein
LSKDMESAHDSLQVLQGARAAWVRVLRRELLRRATRFSAFAVQQQMEKVCV